MISLSKDEEQQVKSLIISNKVLTDDLIAEIKEITRHLLSERLIRKLHEGFHPSPEQQEQQKLREAQDALIRESTTFCANTFKTGTWGFRDMFLKHWHQVGPLSFLNLEDAILFKLTYPDVANIPV